jgi:hypothetical protein
MHDNVLYRSQIRRAGKGVSDHRQSSFNLRGRIICDEVLGNSLVETVSLNSVWVVDILKLPILTHCLRHIAKSWNHLSKHLETYIGL